jgi:hypothetical protein
MTDGHDMNGWGWFGMVLMVFVTVAIVGGVVWSVAARRSGHRQLREPSAREQLDARLARGAIDTQEYRERLHDLCGNDEHLMRESIACRRGAARAVSPVISEHPDGSVEAGRKTCWVN